MMSDVSCVIDVSAMHRALSHVMSQVSRASDCVVPQQGTSKTIFLQYSTILGILDCTYYSSIISFPNNNGGTKFY